MKKIVSLFFFVIYFYPFVLCAEIESTVLISEGEARKKMLVQWEEAMNWVMPFSSRTFSLVIGEKPKVFQGEAKSLEEFVFLYGYFSSHKPLVGIVTEDALDLIPLQNVFNSLLKHPDFDFVELATDELLCKAVSYRNLQKGMKISVPCRIQKKIVLIEYEVKEVLDLWQGMPAFGLISQKKEAAPILLFRGTDFSFSSKSSWASIISDCDLSGIGLTTFYSSQKKIQVWLEKAALSGKKAKVMGFSLGGVLAIYTAIFESAQVDRCITFNAPGVPKSIFNIWKQHPSPPPIVLYATQGDLVSRFGNMLSTAFEISDKTPMGPIEAHTGIMTAKSPILLFQIDIEKENHTRVRAD